MKKQILIICTLHCLSLEAQIVPGPYNTPANFNLNSGFNLQAANIVIAGVGNYNVSGTAQNVIEGVNYVSAQPGFYAGSFTGSGYANLRTNPNIPEIVSFHPNGFNAIAKYEKFEIGVKLPLDLQQKVDNFLSKYTPGYTAAIDTINPYDEDQIQVFCRYTSPSNSSVVYNRNGFYYRDYTAQVQLAMHPQIDDWIENQTDYKFRVRFAPPEVGTYNATVYIQVGSSIIAISSFNFHVVNSGNKGHLRVDQNGRRKLQFENGDVFFGMGQNITGADTPPNPPWGLALFSTPSYHNTHRSYLADLAANSGNFVRIRLDESSVPIENREQMGGAPAPLSHYLTNFNHNQKFMSEMDKTIEFCETRNNIHQTNDINNLYIILQVGQPRLSDPNNPLTLGQNWGPSLQYADNLYGFPLGQGNINSAILNFFSSPTAKKIYKKRLRYIEARWGYSTSIAMWQMMNETEMTPYYDNPPQLTTDMANWTCEMVNYMHSHYPYHLRTTGTTDGRWNDGIVSSLPAFNGVLSSLGLNCLDVYSTHKYEVIPTSAFGATSPNGSLNMKDSYHSEVFGNTSANKLFFHGELGIGHNSCPALSNNDPSQGIAVKLEFLDYRNFHNTIWATAMGGNISTGLMWWDQSEPSHVKHRAINFPAMYDFFYNHVNLNIKLDPIRFALPSTGNQNRILAGNGKALFNYYMVNTNHTYIVGWVVLGSSYWGNDPPSTFDDPNFNADPSNIQAPMAPGSNYNFLIQCAPVNPALDYDISPSICPPIKINVNTYGYYKIQFYNTYNGGGPIGAPIYYHHTSGSYIVFHQNFVNHQNSANIFNYPDYAYIIEYCGDGVTELTGSCAGMNPEEGGSRLINDSTILFGSNLQQLELEYPIKIYPTPANDQINLEVNSLLFKHYSVELYDELGHLILKKENKIQIDVVSIQSGFYLLKFKSDGFEKSFKVTIQH